MDLGVGASDHRGLDLISKPIRYQLDFSVSEIVECNGRWGWKFAIFICM